MLSIPLFVAVMGMLTLFNIKINTFYPLKCGRIHFLFSHELLISGLDFVFLDVGIKYFCISHQHESHIQFLSWNCIASNCYFTMKCELQPFPSTRTRLPQ